jgi:hypothetical protein
MPEDRCVLLLCNAQVLSCWLIKLLAVDNALDERNTEPRGFPPSYAATADAGLVKHKIE